MNHTACPYCGGEVEEDFLYCPHCESALYEGEAPEPQEGFVYEAFISYRHLPNDQVMAKRIQGAIENKPIPKQVREAAGRDRFGRIFRDEDELPTSASLSDQINHALRHSRFLFVLCSPETPKSRWVCHEVEQFIAVRGRNYVIPVLLEGEPADSFPPAFLKRPLLTSDGQVGYTHAEPLAADMRNANRQQFATEIQRLMAPLLGVGFDDLRQRFKMQRQRRIAFLASAVAAFSLVFGGFSVYQQIQISSQLKETQIKESTVLANESRLNSAEGNRLAAIEAALSALPASSKSSDRPFVAEAQVALSKAVGAYPSGKYFQPTYELNGGFKVVSPEGGWLAFVDEGMDVACITIRSIMDGTTRCSVTLDAAARGSKLFPMGDKLLCVGSDQGWCIDANTGDIVWEKKFVGENTYLQDVAVSRDLKHIVAIVVDYEDFYKSYSISSFNAETGEKERQRHLCKMDSSGSYVEEAFAVNEDGSKVAFALAGNLYLLGEGDKKAYKAALSHDKHSAVEFTPNGVVAASFDVNSPNDTDSKEDKDADENVSYSIECIDEKGKLQWGVEGKSIQVASLNNRAHVVYTNAYPEIGGQAKVGSKTYLAYVAGSAMRVVDTANGRVVDQADYGMSMIEGCNILVNEDGECKVYVGINPLGVDVRTVPRKDPRVVWPDSMGSNCSKSWVGYVDGQLYALWSHFGNGSFRSKSYTSVYVKRDTSLTDASMVSRLDEAKLTMFQHRTRSSDNTLIESHALSGNMTEGDDKFVLIMDAETFEVRNKIDLTKILDKPAVVAFSRTEPNVLLVYSSSEKILATVDAITGEVFGKLDVSEWSSPPASIFGDPEFNNDYKSIFTIVSDDSRNSFLVSYDPRTLEETNRIQLPEMFSYIAHSWAGDNRLLVFGHKSTGNNFADMKESDSVLALFDTTTGELIESDIASEAVDISEKDVTTFPEEDLVLIQVENALRAYRLSTGERVGEISLPSSISSLTCVPNHPDCVFVQFADLKLRCINLKTGETKFESEPLTSKLERIRYSESGEMLFAKATDAEGTPVLTVISLKDDQPKVVDYVTFGLEISSNADSVLCQSNSGDYYMVPCYSLDDLIQMGQSELEKYKGVKE